MSGGRARSTLPLEPEEFVQIITGTTSDAIVTIDASSTILFTNSAVERIFGYRPDELLGEKLTMLMPEYLRHVHEQAVDRYLRTGQRHVDWTGVELPGLHREGHEVVLEVSFGESLSKGRQIFTGVIRDISQRRLVEAALEEKVDALHATEEELLHVNERLLHQTHHDALTGLPNRVLLLDRLEQVLRRRKDDPSRDAALLFLDFDRFKVVNDSLGHAVGDAMLVVASRALRHVVRPEDTVARLGGDEFVILLDHVDSQEHSVGFAERVEAAFDEPVQAGGYPIYTSASIGIVPSMFDYEDADAVLRDADTAMYQAKAMGRGCHQVFDQSMRNRAIAAMDLEIHLRKALERDEFSVLYAPVHHLDTGGLSGLEALVHWEHPTRGLLPPGEFLHAATELGITRQIEHWVWREASRNVHSWRARFGRPLRLALNFSGRHFLSPAPERALLDILDESAAEVDQTVIELDEGALHNASNETTAAIRALSERGVRVHIDDFGTDRASLYNLQRFDIDALKIDEGVVAGMTSDPKKADLVRVIVGLATSLGLAVVAKGVETERQRAHLAALGCAYAQGPIFSPPLNRDEVVAYLRARDGEQGAAGAPEG